MGDEGIHAGLDRTGIGDRRPQGQPAPAFEVASVKVSPAREGTAGFTAMDSDPAMVRYSNITLHLLIAIAYKFDSRLITGGPPWLDSDKYDVSAKMPPGTPKDQVPAMLQALLADRFKLALHRETKDQRAYFLVVGKNGPKLKPAREEGGQNMIIPGGIIGHAMTMECWPGPWPVSWDTMWWTRPDWRERSTST